MKLLIAEDDKASRMMLTAVTSQWNYDSIAVEDGEAAWQVMQQDEPPCLLLLDWEMPGMTGIEVCQKVREHNSDNPPYILLLTARTETADIVKGLQAGANDYIPKPFNAAELQVRLEVGTRMLSLQSKLNLALKDLQFHATYDALTEILNRRAILEALNKEIARVQRQKSSLYIGMCDIDHFKKINDTYGHLVGDEVLKEVVKRMKTALRSFDLIGRYGGEEFLVICNATDNKPSTAFERICKFVTASPIKANGHSIPVSISCGVTKLDVDLEHTVDEISLQLLGTADDALYEAKEAGRNRVVFKP
ncbi:diguanylate cyclase response regulator [Methylophaga sp. 41_12_T18]|nr:diguanylate cyclase response regulator [Methylophaga sp. 41_12_T18]